MYRTRESKSSQVHSHLCNFPPKVQFRAHGGARDYLRSSKSERMSPFYSIACKSPCKQQLTKAGNCYIAWKSHIFYYHCHELHVFNS